MTEVTAVQGARLWPLRNIPRKFSVPYAEFWLSKAVRRGRPSSCARSATSGGGRQPGVDYAARQM